MQSVRWGTVILGAVLVLGGLILLAGGLGLFPINTSNVCGLLVALLLIGGGLWTILMVFGPGRGGTPITNRVIGDMRLSLTDKEFTSRSVSTWLGDTRVDLSRATFPEGESTLAVETWIGDIRVKLPRDLAVRARGRVGFVGDLNLLGTRREGFSLDTTVSSQGYEEAPRRLFVDASIVIGDVRVERAG